MTIVKKGDKHTALIIKYWRNYTPDEVCTAEVKMSEQKNLKVQEIRLKKSGIKNFNTILTKFNEDAHIVPEYTKTFILPLSKNRITSKFGNRKHPFTGRIKFHKGIDISGVKGTNIPVANDGKVAYAGYYKNYGNIVVVAHQNNSTGYFTIYAHNSKLLVKEGDIVNRGQTIAKIGSSGKSTGPHLHFELRNRSGELIDPLKITSIQVKDTNNIAKNFPFKTQLLNTLKNMNCRIKYRAVEEIMPRKSPNQENENQKKERLCDTIA
jgi:murein DD-endopeptidase MepM/ murein hydrolase activator NlpD